MRDLAKPLMTMVILCAIVFVVKSPLKTYMEQPLEELNDVYFYELPEGVPVEQAAVESVADGDTITTESGDRVRFLDIDTPELAHPESFIREECYGKDARLRLSQLIAGKVVYLVHGAEDLDKYKRQLRYIFLPLADHPDKYLNVNAYMVGEGFARVYVLDQESKYKSDFFELASRARATKKGLWGACDRAKFRW